MKLLVIIINYRTPQITLDCLASLAPQIGDVPEAEVVVVDNSSGDDSISLLSRAIKKNRWESWADLKAADVNLGFAGGNNLAMDTLLDHQEAQYVLLLNSDTIVHENVLRHCYEKMESDRTIAVLSCMLLNSDETVQNIGADCRLQCAWWRIVSYYRGSGQKRLPGRTWKISPGTAAASSAKWNGSAARSCLSGDG